MRLSKKFLILGFLGLMFVGCTDTGTEGAGGFIPTGKIIAVAERTGSNQTIKVGGTPGAVPPRSLVEVTNLNTEVTETAIGGPDGSFDPTFMGNTNDLFNVLVTDDGTVVEDIRIGVTLLSDAVRRDISNLGSFPDDILIRNNRAYIINGLSDNIQIFDLDRDPPQEIRPPIVIPPGSDPIAMAFLDDTHAYLVNYIGQSVARINVQTRVCETLIVSIEDEGLTEPCQEVIRLSGNPFEEPAGVAVANGKVYVSNNNLDDTFQQPIGNGFITVIGPETNQVIKTINATGTNSGGMTIVGNKIYLVNAGITFFNEQTREVSCNLDFQPSIDIIDIQTDSIVLPPIDITLDPQKPSVCFPGQIEPTPNDTIGYMGLGLVGAMLKVDLISNTLLNGPSDPIIVTDLSGMNFTADIEIREDGLGFVTLFNTDQIAVFDTSNDEVNPFPFIDFFPAGIRADNPNSEFFDGVQFLAIRPSIPGVDFEGADIFFITGISEKLGSINTALVLPPQ